MIINEITDLCTDEHEVASCRNNLGDEMSEVGFKAPGCFLRIEEL